MDTNQLLSDLARAVEATKPAQEYCFLWIDWWATCMTKAEWSGWMQAFGALIGLGIAIWVSSSSIRSERKITIVQSRDFARTLVECMQAMIYSLNKGEGGMFAMANIILTEAINQNQSIRPEYLPKDASNAIKNIKIYGTIILRLSEKFENNPDEKSKISYINSLHYYYELVKLCAEILHKKHLNIPEEKFDAKEMENNLSRNADRFIFEAKKRGVYDS